MTLELAFLGATGTVTGSRYLLDVAGKRLLIDCGLFQGFKQLRLRNWAPFPVPPDSIDAVLLTHAHLDHSGYLPLFVRDGFRGRIHCTEPTEPLSAILLRDSGQLQEEQAEHANRHGYSKHHPALPLYTAQDAERALARFSGVRFDATFEPIAGVHARFLPAGHILGAAMLSLDIAGRRLVFTGDLGRPHDVIMRPPVAVDHADVLVLESTYGHRPHDPGDPADTLAEVITRTTARGGTLIVPSFAVGRAQALLYLLHRLKAEARIPASLPIYLNSPMATDVTSLYTRFRALHRLDAEQCRALAHAATIVNSVDDSKALNRSPWPKVIIAGSGMATGGRVLHHLYAFAPDARNTILLTGFQAGGTRGRALLDGATSIKMFGEHVPVRAEVALLGNLSAHADYVETLAWLEGFRAPPARTFLTHGEPEAADALRMRIGERLGWRCEVPEYLARETLA
ncbi:MAG: MBL fold metallo-hydrolase RNA specificity domain-containing protein [Rudaea sp.]